MLVSGLLPHKGPSGASCVGTRQQIYLCVLVEACAQREETKRKDEMEKKENMKVEEQEGRKGLKWKPEKAQERKEVNHRKGERGKEMAGEQEKEDGKNNGAGDEKAPV